MTNFIAILEILAWPLVTLSIVCILRKPLTSLIQSTQSIKFQGAEVEFSKSLQQTMDDAAEAIDVEISTNPSDSRLHDALMLSPGQSILETWNTLELSATEKVKNLLPINESYKNPLERPLEYLEFKGALTPSTASAIRDLRSMRNQVAHFGKNLVVEDLAIQYISIAEGIMKSIDGITEIPRAKLTAITFLILNINSLIDSKKFEDITIDEVHEWIENESVIPSLAKRVKEHTDLGDYYDAEGVYHNFVEFYHQQLKQIYYAHAGNEGRKWGVDNLGLCLLLAWTNELIQQGSGWHPANI